MEQIDFQQNPNTDNGDTAPSGLIEGYLRSFELAERACSPVTTGGDCNSNAVKNGYVFCAKPSTDKSRDERRRLFVISMRSTYMRYCPRQGR